MSVVALSKRWPIRITRAFLILAFVYNLSWGVFDLSRGHIFGLLSLACVAAIAVTLAWQARYLRRAEIARRPRPDYAAIAAMEREIYGEAFKHEGMPGVSQPEPRRQTSYLRPRHPHGYRDCDCGGSRRYDVDRCWQCEKREHDARHPDTTQPADIEDYVLWLQGYVKRGGKPTHFYDYPVRRADFRYASSTVTVDSDYEYGARSRNIIVANGVTTERTRPAGPFGGWAHTHLYFMHGFRTSDPHWVPVYSDPEFDAIREEFADPWTARSPRDT